MIRPNFNKIFPIHQLYNIHLKLWYMQINNRTNSIYFSNQKKINIPDSDTWNSIATNPSSFYIQHLPFLPFFFFNPKLHTHRDALMLVPARGLHFARTQISFLSKRDRLATFTSTLSWFDPCVFRRCVPTKAFFSLPSDPPGKLQFQRIRRERAKCARAPERISRAEFFNANNSSAGWYDEHVNGFLSE